MMINKKELHLDYYYQLYLKQIPLEKEKLEELSKAGYLIKEVVPPPRVTAPKEKKVSNKKFNIKPKRDYTILTEQEKETDSKIEILLSDEEITITDELCSEKVVLAEDDIKEDLLRVPFGTVRTSDWMPKSVIYHTKEFYDWIDSINDDFSKRKNYIPFNLYCQQADDWIALNDNITDYSTQEEQQEFVIRDLIRCRENTLYACNKYGYLQEPAFTSGRRKYFAGENYVHHRLLLFLLDCGYSYILGKPRQIGSTSVLGMAGMFKTILRLNSFLKFVTENEKTGLEIFNDKIKFSFSQLPEWMKPKVLNYSMEEFVVSQVYTVKGGAKKTAKAGDSAKISVVAPTPTAINGGSPQLVYVDEIGSIPILGDMLGEARPTMFLRDEQGNLVQRRQCLCWGTGTSAKGGAAYEKEWNRVMGLWKERNVQVGFVPVFLNWKTRCDEKFYNEEKKFYYGSRSKEEGIDSETSKIQFHQHYPSSASDMFVHTGKTIMSRDSIDGHFARINKRLNDTGIDLEYGYFEPVYDFTRKIENQDLPYAIKGATFIKTGYADDRTAAIILEHPSKDWIDRWYAGTDPISSDTGVSKMATAIWDEYRHTISCVVNTRDPHNPNYSFLQSMLATIYYDPIRNIGVKEVVERNIGLAYKNYRETKGFIKSLMINAEVDPYFQSGMAYDVGIDNRSHRTRQIINKMGEMLNMFGENIYHDIVFTQAKTFVCNITRNGNEQWGSIDKRFYMDDVLFAATYAYLAAQSSKKQPRNLTEADKSKVSVEYELKYDHNYNLIKVPIVVKK